MGKKKALYLASWIVASSAAVVGYQACSQQVQVIQSSSHLMPGLIDPHIAEKCSGGTLTRRTGIQRLTSEEYSRTVQDLLYLDATVRPGDGFPVIIRSSTQFTNDSHLLTLPPELVEKYFTSALDLASLAMSRSRSKLITCDTNSNELNCIRNSVATLAKRAFRKPVAAAQVDRLMQIFQSERGQGVDPAFQAVIQAVLVAPQFLFRYFPEAEKTGTVYALDVYEIASRMSYFIWRSMPDETLIEKAQQGALATAQSIAIEVKRMLAHPRADAFEESFAKEWLSFEKVKDITFDTAKHPLMTAELKADLLQETRLFVRNLLKEDLSLAELVNANYSFLNACLANYYGISNVVGTEFRKVTLPPGLNRKGIFTQGSLLISNAGGSLHTSPVARGKWLMERFLCDEPPPPPPNTPVLAAEMNGVPFPESAIRQRLEAHRGGNSLCISCHLVMDPMGFGFENFNVAGQWRATYSDGVQVDASGSFPNGTSFNGPSQLLEHLKTTAEVRRCLAQKLTQFAVGRELVDEDFCTMETLAAASVADDSRLSDLVTKIIMTPQFQSNNRGN